MKILLLSDIHFLTKTPSGRIDDIFETQMDKFTQICNIYSLNNCEVFLQAGDFFDSCNPSFKLMSKVIDLLQSFGINILCVAGQHDLYMHSLKSIDKTALSVLESAGVIKILNNEGVELVHTGFKIKGCSYGDEIPKANPRFRGKQVLVIHKLISDRKIFPGQEVITPSKFVKDNPGWDLILCGDYHYHFFEKVGRTTILNTGCMTRKTLSDMDLNLEPCIYIWNVDTNSFKRVPLKVKPVEEVFDLSKKGKIQDKNIYLDKFVADLKSQKGLEVSFADNLREFCKQNKVKREVKRILFENLAEEVR